jgi:penicillin-binding protein 1A
LNLMEHVSAFSVFPDDGIRIDAHLIRRVTTYDGALLEEARPAVHDVISPEVARTMVAMLEDVVNFGTGVGAKALGRPSAGKTGTTNDFTDAWYMGFTPQLTTGVWVGFDDKQKSLGHNETGARAALPIWLEFMQNALAAMPVENFPNVEPLEKVALTKVVHVDTPDTAPAEEEGGARNAAPPQPPPAPQPTVAPQPPSVANPPDPPTTGAQLPPDPRGQ